MWDFSLHHNSHQCRPIFGSSLPYALSIFCDEISNSLLDSDNLVIDITSFGNLLFKSFCLFLPRSSRRGHFFIDINSRLHWDLQNRQTSKTTDQYSTASGASFNNRKSFQLQTVEDQCAKFVCVLYCYGCVLYANVHRYDIVSRN